jgi:hypothetical protein
MQVIRLNKMAAFIVGALSVTAVGAQNVVFTNSNNTSASPAGPYSIPLKAGVPVTVAPNGDIRAQCEIAENGRCVGIPLGGGGSNPPPTGAPTGLTLTTTATDADDQAAGLQVVQGTAFTVNAGASGALACVRSASPGVPAWGGVVTADAASAQVSIGAVGTYTFDFKCLNDAGAASASPLVIDSIAGSAPPPPPTGSCSPANDGFFPPTGLTPGMQLTFTQLWASNPPPAGSNPVGGALTQVKMAGGQYRAFEFRFDMLNANPGDDILEMYADTSNPGSGVARGATWRFVTVSECPGDLRMANPAVGGLLKNGCRVYATEGPFIYLNFGPESNDPAMCNLDKNKTYYMNVTFDSPHDGFNPNAACSDALTSPTDTCGFRWSF